MNAIVHAWIPSLGSALAQMLWQAALAAGLLAVGRRRLRRASAQARYLCDCLALFSLPVVFAATLLYAHATGAEAAWGWLAQTASIPRLLPYLVVAWAVGVAGLSLYSLGGWLWLRRARRQIGAAVPDVWETTLARLRGEMAVAVPVRLGISTVVASPCVAGWWRPLILLPLSTATAMPPDQIAALLAHELAHIRRHDYLVNLCQRAVEVMFFYHPAVWWISRQMAEDREHCCDDAAIAACGDRLGYARALVDLVAAASRREAFPLALAASGGSLRRRIGRIVSGPEPARHSPWRGFLLLTLAAFVSVLGLALAASPRPTRVRALRPAQRVSAPVYPTVSTVALKPQPVNFRRPLSSTPVRRAPRRLVSQPRMTVTFALADYESCAPQLEPELAWVPQPSGAGDSLQIIGVRTVVRCVPVLQPVAILSSST